MFDYVLEIKFWGGLDLLVKPHDSSLGPFSQKLSQFPALFTVLKKVVKAQN